MELDGIVSDRRDAGEATGRRRERVSMNFGEGRKGANRNQSIGFSSLGSSSCLHEQAKAEEN